MPRFFWPDPAMLRLLCAARRATSAVSCGVDVDSGLLRSHPIAHAPIPHSPSPISPRRPLQTANTHQSRGAARSRKHSHLVPGFAVRVCESVSEAPTHVQSIITIHEGAVPSEERGGGRDSKQHASLDSDCLEYAIDTRQR